MSRVAIFALLLAAFARVRQEIPDARLLLVTRDPIPSNLPLAGVECVPPVWDRDRIEDLKPVGEMLGD